MLPETKLGFSTVPPSLALTPFNVRRAQPKDATALLALMRDLAQFEGYISQFCVTENDLLARGLAEGSSREPAQFTAFVAETTNKTMAQQLQAYAVVYVIPFTFDLRPTLVLKELFIRKEARGAGLGDALMKLVICYAKSQHCGRIKWEVLANNTRAKRFYASQGGMQNRLWENWIMLC